MSMRMTVCRGCGAPIVWIKTKAGKSMPCNALPIRYRAKPGGNAKIMTEYGDVVSCEAPVDHAVATGWGYTPHWATCKAADRFKKEDKL